MALITMPENGIMGQSFELSRFDAGAPERSGRIGGITLGFPLWAIEWSLSNLTDQSSDEWRAFMIRLRGSQRSFLAYDRLRGFPKAYPAGFTGMTKAGGGTFTGAANTWSQAVDANADAKLTLTNLPVSFNIKQGDYIGFKWDAVGAPVASFERRALVRAVENVTANGAGTAVVTVEPPVNTQVVPSFAIAHLDKPSCVARLVPDGSSLSPVDLNRIVAGGNISAIQDLRP